MKNPQTAVRHSQTKCYFSFARAYSRFEIVSELVWNSCRVCWRVDEKHFASRAWNYCFQNTPALQCHGAPSFKKPCLQQGYWLDQRRPQVPLTIDSPNCSVKNSLSCTNCLMRVAVYNYCLKISNIHNGHLNE